MVNGGRREERWAEKVVRMKAAGGGALKRERTTVNRNGGG